MNRPVERKGVIVALLLLALTLVFMHGALFPPPRLALGGHDIRGLFYPWLTFARQAIGEGRLPLWDDSQFGGYPFLSNPQVGLFYPPTWLALLLPARAGISWYVALHIWLAGLGMLLFVRSMRGSWPGAVLAAVVFAFSGFTAARIGAGHIGLLATNSWLPWLLLATAWSTKRRDVWSAILAGVPWGLAILAGHTASLLYVGLVWLAFTLYLALSPANLRFVSRQFIIIFLVGLALSGAQLAPLLEFISVSSRTAEPTFEFSTAYSLPPAHLITLLIPDYFGEPARAGYWSVPNFEELTYYAGVLPLLGLLLALRKPSRLTWFYLGLILLGLLLALGSYGFLYKLLYDLAPPFRLARAPGRAAFLFVFAVSALLGETVSCWERRPLAERRAILGAWMGRLLAISAVAGIAALAATGAVFAAQHPTETSGRLWHQLGGWSLALVLALAGGGLLRRYLTAEFTQTKQRNSLAAALVAFALVDLWLFGFKLVRLEPTAPHAMWSDAGEIIGQTGARVLPWGVPIFEQNGAGQVGLRSVFGYNALEVAANTAFAASVPDPRSTAYDILGAGYVLATGPLQGYSEGERPLQLIGQTDAVWVYSRARTLPIARLVYQVEVIADVATAIARVHQPDFDPATTLILEKTAGCRTEPEGAGTVKIVERRPGYWLLETDSDSPALLVLSETAYPGWQVTVSGQPATPYTAYTAVRAVCVAAGTHMVEWAYKPPVYRWGGAVSLAGVLLVGVAILLHRLRRFARP